MRGEKLMTAAEKGKEELSLFFENLKISHNDTVIIEKKKNNLMVSTLHDILQELNNSENEKLWGHVFPICSLILQDYSRALNTHQDEKEANLEQIFVALHNVISLCMASLQIDVVINNDFFIKTVFLLHASILDVNSVSVAKQLCELFLICWRKGVPNNHRLLVNPLIYQLSEYFDSKSKAKISLGEICSYQKAVADLKLSDAVISATDDVELKEGLIEVRQLLISCSLSPGFLKGPTGRKFVANVMLIHSDIMKAVHRAITANMANQTNSNYLEGYGYIYHLAWGLCSDEFKILIEEFGIQDFMYSAIHSTRIDPNLFSSYHSILKGITEHKNSLQVHHMLTRLYKPIIWRALKCRNAMVRANAAELLFDVFPLTTPTDGLNYDQDRLIINQMDAIKDLINDDYAQVRCIAILGLCNMLEMYWDIIPSKSTAEIMSCIFRTCVYDSSSIQVRVSVFKGIIILLRDMRSHSVLKKVLPTVGQCLHDNSEKVRVAFVEMLLQVSTINLIEFWHICPVVNILAQLEVDSKAVCKRLVLLLHDSYLPQPMDLTSWMTRIFCFLKHNPMAARKFYFYCNKLTANECGLFINEISMSICSAVNDDSTENENEFKDPVVVAGLLETICVLWKKFEAKISAEMKKKSGEKESGELRSILKKLTVKVLPQTAHLCFKKYHDERCLNALLLISSYLHPSSIPIFSKGIVPKLRDLPGPAPVSYYSMLIKCIGEWGWNQGLLELISDWLKSSLSEDEKIGTKSRRSSTRIAQKSKSVQFNVEKREPRPRQALNYLQCVLESNTTSLYGSEPCRLLLDEVASSFRKLQQELDRKMSGKDGKYGRYWGENNLLLRALDTNFKLLSSVHLSSKKSPETDLEDVKDCSSLLKINALIRWCGTDVLSRLDSSSKMMQDHDTSLLSTSRDALSSQQLLEKMTIIKGVLNVCFPAFQNLVECGVAVKESTHDFLGAFLQTGLKVVDYIGPILSLFNKLHRGLLTLKWSQSQDGSFADEKDEMLSNFDLILLAMLSYSRKNPDGFHQVFRSDLRSHLQQIISREFQLSTGVTNHTYKRITGMVISSALSDLHHHLTTSSVFYMSDKIVDLPQYCAAVLPVVLNSHAECEYVFSDTFPRIVEESEGNKDIVKPCVSLLHTLQNDCKNKTAAKLCYEKLVENYRIFSELQTEVKNDLADQLNESIASQQ